jgi:hypothetical protein
MPASVSTRRQFLKTAGVAMALPWLESTSRAAGATRPRRRLVAICYPLGLLASNFFPTQAGRDYTLTEYLKHIEGFRNDFTVFSGLSHLRMAETHSNEIAFLTGASCEKPDDLRMGTFRNTVSIDQVAAAHIGGETRFPSLTLGSTSLSFTPAGVKLPGYNKPSALFAKLFLAGNAAEQQAQLRKLRDGQSILDAVRGQAQDVQRDLPARDRARVEEYFNSVRELEQRMAKAGEWEKVPKPKVSATPPKDVSPDTDPVGHVRLLFDLIRLALETDSTRVVAMSAGLMGSHPVIGEGVTDYHILTHHGNDPEKIKRVAIIETELMKAFQQLLAGLKEAKEEGENLLGRTQVLLGSNLGNAAIHQTDNLPVILAGGGFKHGQHLAFSRENNTPLSNLYLSMLQRLGVESTSFGTSKGALKGLE